MQIIKPIYRQTKLTLDICVSNAEWLFYGVITEVWNSMTDFHNGNV